MKKKPYNDNLVMASIEDLYNQANHSPLADDVGLRRQNKDKLPIIGSLPVTISASTADQDSDHLDDMVLTGLLEALPAEPAAPARREPPDTLNGEEQEQDDDPFLAIRQAVISAGQMNKPATEEAAAMAQTSFKGPEQDFAGQSLAHHSFAGQLAELIDAEIERRLTERLSQDTKAAPKKRTTKPKQAKPASTAKKKQKSAAKSKQAKSAKAAPKKVAKARRRPKS